MRDAPRQNLRFGFIQGRLLAAPPGRLQWFPQENWDSEFAAAGVLGVDYIELIAERDHNPGNPIWSDGGVERLKALAAANGMSMCAVGNDYVIDHDLVSDPATLTQAVDLVERARRLGVEHYVLPLFEMSEIKPERFDAFVGPVRTIADAAAGADMTLCVETVLPGRDLAAFLDRLNHPAVGAVFDTGNRAPLGHDLAADIRLLGPRIAHMHVKDKNAAGVNVMLGSGLVDFLAVAHALADIGYDGPYSFETVRGRDPARTARYAMDMIAFLHAEAEN